MSGRKWLFLPPLLIAAALFFAMGWWGSADRGDVATPAPATVRIAPLERTPFTAAASGFGRIEPEETWQAIAQVAGRVAELPADLAIGHIVEKGALVARIDPRDYEIALDKAKANSASAEAAIKEIEVQESNTASLLEIERRIETVREAEYDRQRDLLEKGTSAQASLDEADRALLAQRKVVRDLENQMRLYPVQRLSLQATLDARTVELEEAERDLANTTIRAPFTGLVNEKNVAAEQYVREGDALLSLENIATAEVVAEIQPTELQRVILVHGPDRLRALLSSRDDGEALNFLRELGLKAQVIVRSGVFSATRDAELTRVRGRVDAATGALGLVVRVADPMEPNLQKRRPPLRFGDFAEVSVSAQPRPLLLAPRSAVRRDPNHSAPFIYVMDAEDRLARRSVRLGPVFDDVVALRGGAEPGERLVLTELNPPILGMPLRAEPETASGVPGSSTGTSTGSSAAADQD